MFANSFSLKEWLKVVADDPKGGEELARYWSEDIFSDREASYMSHENRFDYAGLRCPFARTRTGSRSAPRNVCT